MALGKRLINTGAATAACSTDSVQAFGADSAFSSNIALYQLDGDGGVTNNVPDTTTNYDGSASNVTYATGQFGNAAVFNGSNSKIVASSYNINLSTVSVSYWFKDEILLGLQFYKDSQNHVAFGSIGSNIGMYARIGNSFNHTASTTSRTQSGWNHLVFVLGGGNIKVYLNGNTTPIINTTKTYNISATKLNISTLEDAGGPYYYANTLDQVRIFDKAISAEDVATLYAETTSTASNTNPFSEGAGVALYTMDYDASEASGYYDGTPTDVDFGVDGQINYGARFNGTSYIVTPELGDRTTFSYSFWMNMSNASGANKYIFGEQVGGQIFANSGALQIYSNGGIRTFSGSPTVSNNTWHHIVLSVSSGTATVYVDKVNKGTSSDTSTGITAPLYMGTASTQVGVSLYAMQGLLDQVRIFSKALNQTEVDTLFAETACVYTSTTDIVNYPTGTTPVAYYKMDNSSEDYSTGGNDGTDTNIEYRFGRFGQAAVFNGSSSDIQLPDGTTGTGALTISMWVKVNNVASGTAKSLFVFGSGTYVESFIQSNTLYFRLVVGGATDYFLNDGGSKVLEDTWTHVVYVHPNTTTANAAKLFVNGIEVAQGTQTAAVTRPTTDQFIGQRPSNTLHFDGSIDQVRIYGAALTSSQVTELYNEKPEVDTSNFKAVLYTGNGSSQYISNVGFQADLVWIKNRDNSSANHYLIDSVRGIGTGGTYKFLSPDLAGAENSTTTNHVNDIDVNGFTPQGSHIRTNSNGEDYVAWNWKGGGEAVPNPDGSITSQVSANTAAGFSIIKTAGGNSGAGTVGHGLNYAPEMVITKGIDNSAYWWIYHSHLNGGVNPEQYGVRFSLNGNSAQYDASSGNLWNNTAPTNSVISLGVSTVTNPIIYAFHSVSGYSKIGSYNGTSSTGNRIYVDSNNDGTGTGGFEPSFVMLKRTNGTGNWFIYDNKRPNTNYLRPDLSNARGTDGGVVFTSDGFTINVTYNDHNTSGGTYLYMAFK